MFTCLIISRESHFQFRVLFHVRCADNLLYIIRHTSVGVPGVYLSCSVAGAIYYQSVCLKCAPFDFRISLSRL